MNKKHAYLIMASGDWAILKILLSLIDDIRNDIYLHIDLKSRDFPRSEIDNCVKFSKLYYIPRKNVLWADYSMVDVELDLLSAAVQREYVYYHLISGTDIPLKSQDDIHRFFAEKNDEFVAIVPEEMFYCDRKVKFYHPLVGTSLYRNHKAIKIIDRFMEYIQRILKVNRLNKCNMKIYNGWQWFSITHKFTQYLLSQRNLIERVFACSLASDELVVQTIIWNSPYRDNVHNSDNLLEGSMRYIDWKRGNPYVWGKEDSDYDILLESPYLFARKFNESESLDLAKKIQKHIIEGNKNK